METLGFVVLATLALFSAAVVVFHRNPVVCALALAFNLLSIAGFYLLLQAQFLALLQVIVYAGAIMVLILFVIMLLNLPPERRHGGRIFQRLLAPLFALATGAILAWGVSGGRGARPFDPPDPEFGTVNALGTDLFSRYFYPFEAISLLLVVAMIGAVLLAKRKL